MMYKNKIDTKRDEITCRNLSPLVRYCNYFEVNTGSCWGWRFIPDYEFILIVEGVFRYKTENQDITAVKGDILCIPPLVKHFLEHLACHGRGVISCIHTEPVDFSTVSGLCVVSPSPQTITHPADYDFFHSQFKAAADNIEFADEYSAELAVSVVKTIWLSLMKHWIGAADTASPSGAIRRMCSFVKANVAGGLSRNELAAKFGYAPEYVNYLFKKELGVTPSQFISREKVLFAFRLIQQDGLSVKQAAAAVGFYDQYHFSKVFKKITGRRPSEYKR